MNKIKAVLALCAAAVIFTGCGVKNSAGIIKIDNKVITKKEFNEVFDKTSESLMRNLGINAKKDSDNIMVLMAKNQVLSQLVISAILDNAVNERGITVSKEEIDEAEKKITDKFQTKEQFMQLLKAGGASYDDFRKNLEKELKINKYVDSIAMVSIGESEAKKYYNKNIDKFKYPKQVRASHILISASEDAVKSKLKKENKDIKEEDLKAKTAKLMEEAKQKAERLKNELKKNPSTFAQLAKDNSDDKMSAVKGGDLDFFTYDEMTPEFAKAAFSLKPDTISEVIKTPYGFHIIMVTDRKEAGKYSFDETKKDIITLLENQEKMSIFKKNIEELSKKAKVEYLDDEYNPEIIQNKIKEAAKDNPELKKMLEEDKQQG